MTATPTLKYRPRLVAAAKTLAVCVLAAGMAAMFPLAGARIHQQEDAAHWQQLATRYLESEDDALNWSAPASLQMAALRVSTDEADAVRVAARPLAELRTFDRTHIDRARAEASQLDCLATAVYYEARGEGFSGQVAVAEVIMNRVAHSAYPDTVCGVVFQGSERRTGCQFSFTCDGSINRSPRGRAWRRAQLVSEHVMLGFAPAVTRNATHYHTVAIDPHWSGSLVRTGTIGEHIFYRFPSRRERAERERDL
ncbi:MAG: cell wall hydrolase [Maricaulis sp.]|jgi:spore germination cell wall hydrolase CwlJ-like protein|nr:cell wall hydrolase [Maricaulis sp.]